LALAVQDGRIDELGVAAAEETTGSGILVVLVISL